MIKTCTVELDPITQKLSEAFDFKFDGTSVFEIPKFNVPENFSIGLIVGNSGSGKSLILKEYFTPIPEPTWEYNKSIASHFLSFEDACERLFATGLSSVPSMVRPFHVLSNGEKYRATVARMLGNGAVIDEFTSVVDRSVAKSMSVSIRKYISRLNLRGIVFASCHFDIIDWLEPDWVYNTNSHDVLVNGFSLEKFPKLGEFTIS